MQKKKFDLKLSEETIELIKQEAIKDSRTVSGMARKILEDYFKKDDDTPDSIDVYYASLLAGGTQTGKDICNFIDKMKVNHRSS